VRVRRSQRKVPPRRFKKGGSEMRQRYTEALNDKSCDIQENGPTGIDWGFLASKLFVQKVPKGKEEE